MQLNRKKKSVHYFIMILVLTVIFYFFNVTTYKLHLRGKNTSQSANTSEGSNSLILEPKYILLWTNPTKFPFIYFGNGNTVFKERKCKFQNCYVTSNRTFLGDYSEFQVIAFNGPQLGEVLGGDDLPTIRSAYQKYVYANIEAAIYYPICSATWNNFFNWTWTYKLDSDAIWGYLLIRNASNHIIGPSMNIDWIKEEDMEPIGEDIKKKLAGKTKAAAWFVSNCMTMSEREKYVTAFQNYISAYNLKVDVYGDCGDFQCPKSIMKRCLAEVQRNYYFYFAFENALSDDYVTEKIMHGLNYYTVPVVYGGANYSRFMPPGSYLDAVELGPKLLAQKIYEYIQDPESYYNFFKWRRYYSYHFRHESPDSDDYCSFCALINDEALMNNFSTYTNLSTWWNAKSVCRIPGKHELSFHRIIK